MGLDKIPKRQLHATRQKVQKQLQKTSKNHFQTNPIKSRRFRVNHKKTIKETKRQKRKKLIFRTRIKRKRERIEMAKQEHLKINIFWA